MEHRLYAACWTRGLLCRGTSRSDPFRPERYGSSILEPLRLTAGRGGRACVSTLQVFFLSVLVFVKMAYVLRRTGVLADLSTTVLELLAISGIGATAAKG